MTDTARFSRRPAPAKLPVSTTARKILIWSKVGVTGTGLKMFRTSWFILVSFCGASAA